MAELVKRGAHVTYHDPYVTHVEGREWTVGRDIHSTPLTAESLEAADCVVILTDHRAFDYEMIRRHARVIVDTRNAIKGRHRHVFKLGAPVVS
jgi:UDP-N-acetyl-D-glucosamine dehydrogenase